MIRFSANLGFLWPDRPLLERIDAAAKAGFAAIELHWPFDTPANDLRARCEANGVTLLGINTPPGDLAKGDFGLAAVPDREEDFRALFALTAAYARRSHARHIHVMAGVVEDRDAGRRTLLSNLAWALDHAPDLTLVLEAINPHDCPGYFYSRPDEVREIVELLATPRLGMMFDCYHTGRTETDLIAALDRCLPLTSHVQIAAVPDRGEPDRGVVNYAAVFDRLEYRGYDGWVGCEYKPRGDTDAGLTWLDTLGVTLSSD
jgi:2-dehydrotetronate isomerase